MKKIYSLILLCICSYSFSSEAMVTLSSNWHSHLYPGLIKQMQSCFGIDSLIETGTLNGECAYHASPYFREIHTIELAPHLYERSCNRLKDCPNVRCYLGDSSKQLLPIIQQAQGTILFWLDAHYSGGETACGELGDPIFYELNQIAESRRVDSVILIDDIRSHDIPKACVAINAIDEGYVHYIIGDILLAFNTKYHSPKISSLVIACSQSRISENISEIINAEKFIIDSEEIFEKSNLTELYKQYLGYYNLWEGLVNLGKRKYEAASTCFEKMAIHVKESGPSIAHPWRIWGYLVKSYHESNQYEKAKQAYELVSPFVAENENEIRIILGNSIFATYN